MSACWVCGSSRHKIWKRRSLSRELRADDLQITDARYGVTLELHRCDDCGFIFADAPELQRLEQLYGALEDHGYEESQEGRELQMAWLLRRLMAQHQRPRTLLDVGAGTGVLVSRAREAGLDAVGVEPSRWLVEAAARLHQVDLIEGALPVDGLGKFDLVTAIDVVEHVSDPVAFLQACADRLAPGGVLLVVTPDVSSVAARLLGKRWWHFRLAHIGYFNAHTLARALTAAGLRPIHRERPRWFFRADYLVERAAQYVPPLRVARGLFSVILPLDLRDSLSWFCTLDR